MKLLNKGTLQLIIVIGVIFLAFFLSEALKPSKEYVEGLRPAQASKTKTVSTFSAIKTDYTPTLTLSAVVSAASNTDIAAQISGKVSKVSASFKNGGVFQKGDVLFEIESIDYELKLESSLADVKAAKSDLDFLIAKAEIAVEDWKKLFPGQKITPLGSREPQIAAATARLNAAVANQKKAHLELNRTKIKAPFSGRVIETGLEVGQVVAMNAAVGKVYALDAVQIEASAAPRQLTQIDPVLGRVVTDLGGHSIGLVDRLKATLDPKTRLATVYISPTSPRGLLIGQFLQVRLVGPNVLSAVRIPRDKAILGKVWVVRENKLAQVPLTLLGSDSDTLIVLDFPHSDSVLSVLPFNAQVGQAVTVANKQQ
ncbi:efflux RND transporter periplasmic adaptor subunit [Temperatibacter marinus]|uniref:Efflux RND transporter periplasmic adaptor subunit n=1 Tax=Temperatibacter marinus TaxID=1456591 RepID=A0AA52EJS9_9PROT|nr:efflux RND transporter periplasmic adaptor subunit [Temperatibacter marinus]WND03554.1 efflux RND transporter periplasmic adaptor subunit [Temperatibacter marinus]